MDWAAFDLASSIYDYGLTASTGRQTHVHKCSNIAATGIATSLVLLLQLLLLLLLLLQLLLLLL